MDQRTCNIINCCKHNCGLELKHTGAGRHEWAGMVAAYMAKECACPPEDYTGQLLESIMAEALFDYMNTADKPGADLRRLFNWPGMGSEPTMCERIASVFSLVTVRGPDGRPVNGFTDDLIRQSRIDLECAGAMAAKGDDSNA